MNLQRMLSGDPSRTSLVYLTIGAISLVKAVALRNDSSRFRRELMDAGLFLGIGLLLRRYGKMKARKQAELMENAPDWLLGGSSGRSGQRAGIRSRAKRRLGREPEPEPTVADRARRVITGRK